MCSNENAKICFSPQARQKLHDVANVNFAGRLKRAGSTAIFSKQALLEGCKSIGLLHQELFQFPDRSKKW